MTQGITSNDTWLRTATRFIGYALLAVAFFDLVAIFSPPNFQNAPWEYQLAGELVERMPVPLLGLGFVFFGEASGGKKRSLQILSWLCLVVAVAYVALVPLALSAAWRINKENENNVTIEYTKQLRQVLERKDQLTRSTAANMEEAYTILKNRGSLGDIQNTKQLKERLFSEINKAEEDLKTKADTSRQQFRLSLVKNSVKWNMGAIVAAFAYFFIWQITTKRNKLAQDEGWSSLQF